MSKCNRDCFNCSYTDCINDEIKRDKETTAIERQAVRDSRLYQESRQFAIDKYNHSAKKKATEKRYMSTEKGKATRRKAVDAYTERNKELVRERAREHYYANRERILAEKKLKRRMKREVV